MSELHVFLPARLQYITPALEISLGSEDPRHVLIHHHG